MEKTSNKPKFTKRHAKRRRGNVQTFVAQNRDAGANFAARGNKTNPSRYGSERRKTIRKQTPTNTNAVIYKNGEMPMDDWTFWTLVAGAVAFSGLFVLGVVWAIIH